MSPADVGMELTVLLVVACVIVTSAYPYNHLAQVRGRRIPNPRQLYQNQNMLLRGRRGRNAGLARNDDQPSPNSQFPVRNSHNPSLPGHQAILPRPNEQPSIYHSNEPALPPTNADHQSRFLNSRQPANDQQLAYLGNAPLLQQENNQQPSYLGNAPILPSTNHRQGSLLNGEPALEHSNDQRPDGSNGLQARSDIAASNEQTADSEQPQSTANDQSLSSTDDRGVSNGNSEPIVHPVIKEPSHREAEQQSFFNNDQSQSNDQQQLNPQIGLPLHFEDGQQPSFNNQPVLQQGSDQQQPHLNHGSFLQPLGDQQSSTLNNGQPVNAQQPSYLNNGPLLQPLMDRQQAYPNNGPHLPQGGQSPYLNGGQPLSYLGNHQPQYINNGPLFQQNPQHAFLGNGPLYPQNQQQPSYLNNEPSLQNDHQSPYLRNVPQQPLYRNNGGLQHEQPPNYLGNGQELPRDQEPPQVGHEPPVVPRDRSADGEPMLPQNTDQKQPSTRDATSSESSDEPCDRSRCPQLDNCINVTRSGCCDVCETSGCQCEGYQFYDCLLNGFEGGLVPEGASYSVDMGSTTCSCPMGGGIIMCSYEDQPAAGPRLLCAEPPITCIETYTRPDGCVECIAVGCVGEEGSKHEAGSNFDRPPCSTCYCPPEGGDLYCLTDPVCSDRENQPNSGEPRQTSQALEATQRVMRDPLSPSEGKEDYKMEDGYDTRYLQPDWNQFGAEKSDGSQGSDSQPIVPPLVNPETAGLQPQQFPSRPYYPGTYDGYYNGYNQQYPSYPYNNFRGYGQQVRQGYDQQAGYPNEPGGQGQGAAIGPGYNQQSPSDADYDSNQGGNKEQEQSATNNQDSSDEQTNAGQEYEQRAPLRPTYDQQAQVGQGFNQQGPFLQGYGQQAGIRPGFGQNVQGYDQEASLGRNFGQQQAFVPAYGQQVPVGDHQTDDSISEDGNEKPGTSEGEDQPAPTDDEVGDKTGGQSDSQSELPPNPDTDGSNTETQDGDASPPSLRNPGGNFAPNLQGNFPNYPINPQNQYGPYYNPNINYDRSRQFQQPNAEQGNPQNSYFGYAQYPIQGQDEAETKKGDEPSDTADTQAGGDAGQKQHQQQQFTHLNGLPQNNNERNPETPGQIPNNANPYNSGFIPYPQQFPQINPGFQYPYQQFNPAYQHPYNFNGALFPPQNADGNTGHSANETTPREGKPTEEPPSSSTTTTTQATTTTISHLKAATEAIREINNHSIENNQTASFDNVLSVCCYQGQQWAISHDTCTGMQVTVNTYGQICAVAQEKCCAEAKEQETCKSGISTARSMAACDVPAEMEGQCDRNGFKTCCDCCALGLKAYSLSLNCDIEILGHPCNSAYSECCRKGRLTSGVHDTPVTSLPKITFTTQSTSPHAEEQDQTRPRCETHNNCPQVCVDTDVGIECACLDGFQLEFDGATCTDINECVLGTHNCVEGQFCLNTLGSFNCQRSISCGTGYELTDKNTCNDIDECALNIHNCGQRLNCVNIRGSFRCVPRMCDDGYFTDATGGCIDIDECRAGDFSCPPRAHCANTIGSYSCRCPDGLTFDRDGHVCQDIDECQLGTSDCAEGSTCVNTDGSFTCLKPPMLRCTAGYKPNEDGTTCVDIDECNLGTHTCASGSTCINEEGSFRCQDPLQCKAGTRPNSNQRSCIDIDECDEDGGTSLCGDGGVCVNLPGSYRCECSRGYKKGNSSTGAEVCEDIDECSLPAGRNCMYRCQNNPGSFTCVCPDGYALSRFGRTCKDIDECLSNGDTCSTTETCFNTRGSHKCVELDCPDQYAKLSNRRCLRQSCRKAEDRRACSKLPKQISYHNISVRSNAPSNKALFQMSLARGYPTDRYYFLLTEGNEDRSFRVSKKKVRKRQTGIVYTTKSLTGPRDYVLDLTLKLYRRRRWATFISRLYIYVSEHDF